MIFITLTFKIDDIVYNWNKFINDRDFQSLKMIYSPHGVIYYGEYKLPDEIIIDKSQFINKHPDYKQTIQGSVNVSKIGNEVYKLEFTKVVEMDGNKKFYPSYLLVYDGKIILESDYITDKNLDFKLIFREEILRHFPVENLSGEFNYNQNIKLKYKCHPPGEPALPRCEFKVLFNNLKDSIVGTTNSSIRIGTYDFDNDKIDEIVIQEEYATSDGISIYKISSSKLTEIASWSEMAAYSCSYYPIAFKVKNNFFILYNDMSNIANDFNKCRYFPISKYKDLKSHQE